MLKVAPVNYTNTYPLTYHLDTLVEAGEIELVPLMPSRIPEALAEGRIDLGLAPVGGLSALAQYEVVGQYGIATESEVASVCLFSDVPIEQIKTVYLDYQSRTSVKLVQWLFTYFYRREVDFIPTQNDSYIQNISGESAGLVIGDRAFELLGQRQYVYDLGTEWHKATGLPFVFAVWTASRKLPPDFVQRFDELQARGVADIESVIAQYNLEEHSYDMRQYYTQNITYKLEKPHREAMRKFLGETSHW